ncbi:AIPR family protein [Corallococcus silvisoli]|uniref:AIPR family protein n=1 Tax=Corallococcus silvisoli TaxID=2697031 RepID=UPI0013790AB2|nr:AIPR family protein [Corallococcus silvisoli]NBD13598.1 hypothetical protein [Corallococcus silvisoli]
MAHNDQVLLDEILNKRRVDLAPELGPSEFFELFAAEQILKEYDLSYDELSGGITDSGGDGGLDAIYLFANGELVQDDTDLDALKKNIALEWVIIQSKTTASFEEEPLNKARAALEDALRFDRPLKSLGSVYNEEVLAAFDLFRTTYTELAPRFPTLKISFYYASRGDQVHPNVSRKTAGIVQAVQDALSGVECTTEFVNASRLLALARKTAPTSFGLTLAENPISAGSEGFLCLVRLSSYYNFITDDAGRLRRHLFEANVRDYQGSTEVNEGIRSSLGTPSEDFWWLNNGITILASKVALSGGKVLTVQDPQVVNGLQTSTEVYGFFKGRAEAGDSRNVLVRVFVSNDVAGRDRIIKATNSQNQMPSASLRATDKVQRDIEEYFLSRGLYYDRRKNFYKNEGKPLEKIVSIPYLAQAVMAIVVQDPHNSRGKPSSLLKSNADYARVFDPSFPLSVFLVCVNVMRIAEAYLRAHPNELALLHRNNVKFHLAMYVVAHLAGVPSPKAQVVAALDLQRLDDALLKVCLAEVSKVYLERGGSDQVAKRKEFGEALQQLLVEKKKAGTLVAGAPNTTADLGAPPVSASAGAVGNP